VILPEDPPSFVVRTELSKAAFDNGFRLEAGSDSGWIHYRSTTARGEIWLAAAGKAGPWFLSISFFDQPAAAATEIGLPPAVSPAGPGFATYTFATLAELHLALDRTYRLGVSLPDAPLREFLAATSNTPRSTEAERLVVQRVGQNIFREALLKYWNGRCPLTGITEPALLRASHIVPWAECESDALRLDVHNGLLLSALWDAAFDAGLVSFDDGGFAIYSGGLSAEAAEQLRSTRTESLRLTEAHRVHLARHRRRHGFDTLRATVA
jgi:hypothetical protein